MAVWSRVRARVVAAGAAGAVVLGCASASGAPGGPVLRVSLSDFRIGLSSGSVASGRVRFQVVNRGNLAHNFVIGGVRTRTLVHGAAQTISAVLRPGLVPFSSSLRGQAAVGMAGTLRVTHAAERTTRPYVTRSRLQLTTVATGLEPLTFVASPPGDQSRLMVVQQDGIVLLFKDGVRAARPFLDLRSVVRADGEQGLLSLAFSPDYAESGRLYVYFNNEDGNIRVVELRRSGSDPDVVDTSRRRVLALTKSAANHNGGMLQFGPDGYLYIAIGDGGASPPESPVGQRGQTLDDLFAAILRIDPRNGDPYAIPPGNPFATVEGARPEIVAYGLRNPWRFWIDARTRTMLIGDVGEGEREEIDRLPLSKLGVNFGWPCREGTTVPPKVPVPAGCASASLTPPLYEYPHSKSRCSVTAGVTAQDPRLPALDGLFLWSDFCDRQLYALTSGARAAVVPLGLGVAQPTSFGVDGLGRIYVTTAAGSLYRLDLGPASP